MRRFLQLATVLLVAAVAAGAPLAPLGSHPAAPAVAAAAPAAPISTPQAAAIPGIDNPAVLCILPQCDGPYCRGSNGCLVCCTH